jgi:hypothetical protein
MEPWLVVAYMTRGEGEKSGRGVCVEGKKYLAWLVDW